SYRRRGVPADRVEPGVPPSTGVERPRRGDGAAGTVDGHCRRADQYVAGLMATDVELQGRLTATVVAPLTATHGVCATPLRRHSWGMWESWRSGGGGMAHTAWCDESVSDVRRCRCSCGGTLHGRRRGMRPVRVLAAYQR